MLTKQIASVQSIAIVFALSTIFAMIVLPQLARAQTFTVIHYFSGGGDGDNPYGGITLDGAGNLFGTTVEFTPGTVFEIKQRNGNWVLNTLFTLNQNTGIAPGTGVVIGPNGGLYGTTLGGGSGNGCQGGCGTVYKLTPLATPCRAVMCSWTAMVLYSFTGGQDGSGPGYGNVVFDQAGNLYGTTTQGGDHGMGVIFKLTPSGSGWTETVLHSFNGADGSSPDSGVVLDAAGNLYGTTVTGGTYNEGTAYQLAHSGSGWVLNTLYSFQGASDGYNPVGGLIFDAAGNLYGTTSFGGSGGGGTVFELSPSGGGWTFALLYALAGGLPVPGGPTGSLAFDAAGNLYGTTFSDGAYGSGSVFRLHPNASGWTYSTMHDFTGYQNDGQFPVAGPTVGPLNTLYGQPAKVACSRATVHSKAAAASSGRSRRKMRLCGD